MNRNNFLLENIPKKEFILNNFKIKLYYQFLFYINRISFNKNYCRIPKKRYLYYEKSIINLF